MKKTKVLVSFLLAFVMVFSMSTAAFGAVEAIKDGKYEATVTTGEKMFKVIECTLNVEKGEMSADVLLSGTGYYALFLGTKEEALASYNAKDESKWIKPSGEKEYTVGDVTKKGSIYSVPISSLDKPISVISISKKYYDQGNIEKMFGERVLTFDGTYKINVDTGNKMFKVVDCTLTIKDGQKTAEVLLSGTGYYALFLGTKEEALASYNAKDESKWIKSIRDEEYTVNGVTKTGSVYVVPVDSLDKQMPLISISNKYYTEGNVDKMFYERTFAFDKESMMAELINLTPITDENQNNTGGNGNDVNNNTNSNNNAGNADKDQNISAPQTGDNSAILLFAGLLAISSISAVIYKKRNNA